MHAFCFIIEEKYKYTSHFEVDLDRKREIGREMGRKKMEKSVNACLKVLIAKVLKKVHNCDFEHNVKAFQ